jgi:hypothetical protein
MSHGSIRLRHPGYSLSVPSGSEGRRHEPQAALNVANPETSSKCPEEPIGASSYSLRTRTAEAPSFRARPGSAVIQGAIEIRGAHTWVWGRSNRS